MIPGDSDLHPVQQIMRLAGTMNIGLFGGTFDPIHRGHIALARAAQQRCKLSRIYFVPANVPPHKEKHPIAPFLHRYAMIALATAQEKAWSREFRTFTGRAGHTAVSTCSSGIGGPSMAIALEELGES